MCHICPCIPGLIHVETHTVPENVNKGYFDASVFIFINMARTLELREEIFFVNQWLFETPL